MEVDDKVIDQSILENGAKEFEFFWLRPITRNDGEAILRMKIMTKWGGWKLKDDLVTALGLRIGDTMNAEVKVLCAPGFIKDASDMDLFASGKGADWLEKNEVGEGSVIEAKVRFAYVEAPVGRDGKNVWTVNLVFLEGYRVVSERTPNVEEEDVLPSLDALRDFFGDTF